MGPQVQVLDRDHAANADAGDPTESDRPALVSIFGAMGGIAGAVALFVVAGRSRSRSPSAGARPPCCAHSARRRARSGA